MLSATHILLVVLVVFVLFGAGRLPRLMGDFADGIKAFKKGMKEDDPKINPPKSDTNDIV